MFHEAPTPMLEYGSIGWEDDDEYIFPGDDSNDGHTLVRVQLFRGRDSTKPLNSTRAQGLKLVAHVNSLGGFRTPPKDTRCMVAVPAGMESTPGAAIIMGIVEKSGARFDNLPNGSVAMSAGQGEGRVMTNNDGSVSLYTTDTNARDGRSVYIRVAKDGIYFNAPWGVLRFDASGFHVIHSSGASIDLGAIYGMPQPFDQLTSYVKMQAASIVGTATTIALGPSAGPVAEPLTAAVQAQLACTALQLEIRALQDAIDAMALALTSIATGGVGGIPAFGTAWNLAVTGAAAKVTALNGVVGTNSTVVNDAIQLFPRAVNST